MLIAWPTANSWVLSHRQATGNVPPVLASTLPTTTTATYFQLVPHLSSLDSAMPYAVVSYLRLTNMPSDYQTSSPETSISKAKMAWVYASSSMRPTESVETARISKHDQVSLNPLFRARESFTDDRCTGSCLCPA